MYKVLHHTLMCIAMFLFAIGVISFEFALISVLVNGFALIGENND